MKRTVNGYKIFAGADLVDADLCEADLRGADLRGADLSGADLSDADLRDADLSGANLATAKLNGSDLGGADLRGANLRYCNLDYARFVGADTRNATFSQDADLSNVEFVEGVEKVDPPVVEVTPGWVPGFVLIVIIYVLASM